MTVKSLRFGPVLVVRFPGKPDVESIAAVRALTAELVQGDEPLSFVGLVPGKLMLPGAALKARFAELRAELRPFTASVHFAIEGGGFFARMQRGMFTALAGALASQVRFFVHETAEQALQAVGGERRLDTAALLAQAKAAGLVSP
jgi:hypothetical protein